RAHLAHVCSRVLRAQVLVNPRVSMATRETGKQRAARIPLDYYKRPNRMERWKSTLALLALLACVGVTAGAWVLRDGGKPYLTRGPVAVVHAAWDNKCEACHDGFQPMSKSNVLSAFFKTPGSHDSSMNARCETCHNGTVHHETQLNEMT